MERTVLKKIFPKELVFLDADVKGGKEDIFSFAADQLVRLGYVTDSKKFICDLTEREKLGSTYMGEGIAIPHGRSCSVKQTSVAFIRLKNEISYESVEGNDSVKYIFVFALNSEHNHINYLKTLAFISKCLLDENVFEVVKNEKEYERIIDAMLTCGGR